MKKPIKKPKGTKLFIDRNTVEACGGKRGRGCSSAFEWLGKQDRIKPIELVKK